MTISTTCGNPDAVRDVYDRMHDHVMIPSVVPVFISLVAEPVLDAKWFVWRRAERSADAKARRRG